MIKFIILEITTRFLLWNFPGYLYCNYKFPKIVNINFIRGVIEDLLANIGRNFLQPCAWFSNFLFSVVLNIYFDVRNGGNSRGSSL